MTELRTKLVSRKFIFIPVKLKLSLSCGCNFFSLSSSSLLLRRVVVVLRMLLTFIQNGDVREIPKNKANRYYDFMVLPTNGFSREKIKKNDWGKCGGRKGCTVVITVSAYLRDRIVIFMKSFTTGRTKRGT